jgi:hypothetical protein
MAKGIPQNIQGIGDVGGVLIAKGLRIGWFI